MNCNEKTMNPFPKVFVLSIPRKDGLMFSCLFWTNNREQSPKFLFSIDRNSSIIIRNGSNPSSQKKQEVQDVKRVEKNEQES